MKIFHLTTTLLFSLLLATTTNVTYAQDNSTPYNLLLWPRVANQTIAENTCGIYMDEIQQAIQEFMCHLQETTSSSSSSGGGTRNLRSSTRILYSTSQCKTLCQAFAPGTCYYAYPSCRNRRRQLHKNDDGTEDSVRDLAILLSGGFYSLVQTTYNPNSCFYAVSQLRSKFLEVKNYYDSMQAKGKNKNEIEQMKACATIMTDMVFKCDFSGVDPTTEYAKPPANASSIEVQQFLTVDGYIHKDGVVCTEWEGTDAGCNTVYGSTTTFYSRLHGLY